jgi:sugar O-acyltransferase (sialic acid O-acetyltransferase NeuD family)
MQVKSNISNIAIYGAGGFGKEVLTLINDLIKAGENWNFIGFFDDKDCSDRLGALYLGNFNVLNQWSEPLALVLAIGWSHIRKQAAVRIQNPLIEYPYLISPRCIIGDTARIRIGKGSLLMSGANLTTDIEVGEFVVVNINATIGHDAVLGNFSSLMPSVNISGSVVLGDEVFIGSGTTVLQNISIGSKSIIGAGAVVTKSIIAGSTSVGVPARIIKSNHG